MNLLRNDFTSLTWKRLTDDLSTRLEELRAMNDGLSLTETQTAVIRGKIAEVKRILSLANAGESDGELGEP